ncbi:outer membrane beta-barrel family protein [Myroides odoratimimus]|uniref:outer membrane beta-barrel family protein n=1 Tax=Myroides odoratimimus TaxID=76832 RepID=UPI00090EF711|nr:outer membrane beta-barrel family protein [Myroides odoratimimus]SHL23082.1 Outer membrane receptor proteins, mostly Fe transport [Myroides odoratimimus subsp. xuanwuensis]
MKYSLFILFLLFTFTCKAQYRITGQLKDNNNEVIFNCAIKLKKQDTIIKSVLSDENGKFTIENIQEGLYSLELTSVYYNDYQSSINIISDISLGVIFLSEKALELDELIITSQRKPVKQTDTGVILNVSGTRLQNQPDLISILNYAPTISTNNGLKVLGDDNILIQLDGKDIQIDKSRISTFLETINPKTIENIEVIDRVDGSVQSNKTSLIKITTIQKEGWSGNIRQGLLYNDKGGYSTDASLFYKREQLRVFGNYYHSRHKTSSKGHESQIRSNSQLYYTNTENSKLNRKSDYVTLGADYDFNDNSSISFLYLFEDDQDHDHQREVSSQITGHLIGFDSLVLSKAYFNQINKMHSFSLSFTNVLDSLGSKFNTSIDIAKKYYTNPFYQLNSFQNDYNLIKEENQQNSRSNNDIYAFNISRKKKYQDKKEFSLGARASLVDNKDGFHFLDLKNEQWITNTDFSNDFFLKEYILSVYSIFSMPIKEKSKLSLGLRAEYNYNDYTNGSVEGNNHNLRLLPNISYSTKVWDNKLYISASQRVSRPSYSLFNPTYIKSSPLSAYMGNENLKPIDIYSLQTGYSLKNNLRLDLRYRYLENNILTIPRNTNGILITSPTNIGYRNDLYTFVSFPYKISDWWETNTKLTGAYLELKLPTQKFSSLYADFSINNTFYLPLDIELNAYYSYTSAYRMLYTKNKNINSLNLNISYPISRSFNLHAGVNDVFNSLRSSTEYDFNGIYNYNYNKFNSRSFSVSVSYNFSKGKEVDDDIRNTGIEEEKRRF